MICFYEIVSSLDGWEQTTLVHESELEQFQELDYHEKAEDYVTHGSKVLEVRKYCDDDLLELLRDFYTVVKHD
jgi:hypothetical protein